LWVPWTEGSSDIEVEEVMLSNGSITQRALHHAQTIVLLVVLETIAGAPFAQAQSPPRVPLLEPPTLGILGNLVDSITGAPVPAATIELLAQDRSTIQGQTISNVNGQFRVSAPSPGTYYVKVWRLALDTLIHGPVETALGSPVMLQLRVRAHPIQIKPLDVRIEARVRFLLDRGFYDRQMVGAGVFLTPEELANRGAFLDTRELMRTVPGVLFPSDPSFVVTGTQSCGQGWRRMNDTCVLSQERRTPPMLTRSGLATANGMPCLPAIYLDGLLVQNSGDVAEAEREFDLTTIAPAQIIAIEAFRSAAEVPVQFGGGSASCGAVLVWTVANLPPSDV
jgi:hypothetical protein